MGSSAGNRHRLRILLLPLLLLSSIKAGYALRIHHLWVPDRARLNGSEDARSAVLDCDYTLDQRDEDSLEVKWYFRQDEAPIYQWVPPNEPQILSARFEDHINLGYRATTDPLSERRALHLVDLTTEHSGRYSCRVSSNHQDEFRAKDMVIYAPPTSTKLNLEWLSESSPSSSFDPALNVSCSMEGAFPEPRVGFALRHFDGSRKGTSYDLRSSQEATVDSVVTFSGGSYSVAASILLRFPVALKVLSGDSGGGQPGSSAPRAVSVRARDAAVACIFEIPAAGYRAAEERRVPPALAVVEAGAGGDLLLHSGAGMERKPILLFVLAVCMIINSF